MKKLNIAYFGTPSFSALFLEKLITDVSINQLIDIKLVVTQPDRPVGRKQILTPTPVKLTAIKYKLPVIKVGKWKVGLEAGQEERNRKIEEIPTSNFQFPNPLRNLSSIFHKIDLALVFAFGEIIPKELLNLPRLGFINIHPSLLPKYRGPSPIAYPLINGDTVTGVTLIKMDEQIDHGPIIAQKELNILPTDRRQDLEIKLTDLAFEMFKKLLINTTRVKMPVFRDLGGAQSPLSGPSTPKQKNTASNPWLQALKEQNHQEASYTKLLKKSDGFIPFENLKLKIKNSPKIIYNYFRGLYPWPGIWTLLRQGYGGQAKRLKITDMALINDKLVIKKVQLEGKKEVDFETFNRAYKVTASGDFSL